MCEYSQSQMHNLLAPQVTEKDLGVESLPLSGYWISLLGFIQEFLSLYLCIIVPNVTNITITILASSHF